MHGVPAGYSTLAFDRAPLRNWHPKLTNGVTFPETEIYRAEDEMYARPIRIAAALVVIASFVSTAAYASDASPIVAPSPPPIDTSAQQLVVSSPDQLLDSPLDKLEIAQADRQSDFLLDVIRTTPVTESTVQQAPISDSNLLSAAAVKTVTTVVKTVVVKATITGSDVITAQTGSGAKLVASKWNSLTYSWSEGQMGCLSTLWSRESHWNFRSRNSRSGAYGIPQANPGTKMASAGSDWRSNPITQIKWGMSYVNSRYGSPCEALSQSNRFGWY
jgi:hypothetical protein